MCDFLTVPAKFNWAKMYIFLLFKSYFVQFWTFASTLDQAPLGLNFELRCGFRSAVQSPLHLYL